MKLIFLKLVLNSFSEHVHLISRPYDLNSDLINNTLKSSAERLMVRTTQKSYLPWSAIFSVIIYCSFSSLKKQCSSSLQGTADVSQSVTNSPTCLLTSMPVLLLTQSRERVTLHRGFMSLAFV